jgi:hypothetical protein
LSDAHWPDHHAITVDRPAWPTVIEAIRRFVTADGKMALGDPHRIHLVEVVARRHGGTDADEGHATPWL